MSDNYKNWEDTPGEEMLCAILYLDNSDKSRLTDLNKTAKNDYILNKA